MVTMKSLIVISFFLFITAILCSGLHSVKISPRIIGGSEAGKNEWPMIVSIMKKLNFKQICGGTIISQKHVLTAGHCMYEAEKEPLPLDSFGVVYGAHDLLKIKKEDIHSPKKAVLHPKYKFEIHFDVCILEMDEIPFSDIVKPACIPSQSFDFQYKILTHMGWGKTKAGGFDARKLQKTQLHIVERKLCEETYSKTDYMDKKEIYQVCTFQKGTSQCQGDSGGPVQWYDTKTKKYNLVGAISFGWPTCDKPSVITDVTYFNAWIRKTVKGGGAFLDDC